MQEVADLIKHMLASYGPWVTLAVVAVVIVYKFVALILFDSHAVEAWKNLSPEARERIKKQGRNGNAPFWANEENTATKELLDKGLILPSAYDENNLIYRRYELTRLGKYTLNISRLNEITNNSKAPRR